MSTMYCALCRRPVEAGRQIGVGTVALAVATAGIWLVAIPFYPKRCSICRSTALSSRPPDEVAGGTGGAQLSRLEELERRLRIVEDELEAAGGDLRRLKDERDFYSKLLDNPASRRKAT